MKTGLRRRYIGSAAFYKMVLAVAVPIMIQNGITNFVSLLDNIMVGRVGTEQMTGVSIVNQLIFVLTLPSSGRFPARASSAHSSSAAATTRVCAAPSASSSSSVRF